MNTSQIIQVIGGIAFSAFLIGITYAFLKPEPQKT